MKRVLLVDDNEQNLYYLKALLAGHGWQVEIAQHGAEALVKARAAPPDLIVSDLLMPVMDGYTLLRHWKGDARLRPVPFVVYTATYTEPEDKQLALDMGADAFILKPAEPDDFIARIDEAQRSRSPAAASTQLGGPEERLREYSETLIRKLEHKTLQLEESNQALQRDVAARVAAEVALRQSEELFRQLAENIDDVFWLSDPEGRVMFYVSPAYDLVFGRSRSALYAVPGSWFDSAHPADRGRIEASARQMSESWDETYRIVRPDGSIRWIRARAYPVRDASNRIYRTAGVARDITEYRSLEEQLRQAQKMEAVGRLAGGVAHDFNNLLSVILSYTSMVLEDARLDEPVRGDIQEIHRAGERATELTRQLLAFSRQQVLLPKVMVVGQVVRDMEKMLCRLLGEDVELELATARQEGKVHADPSQVEQLVMNFAVNARDAMPRGGKFSIRTADVELDSAYEAAHPGVKPGRYVMLSASDNGIGMDNATRERIFEPFFTTKEKGKGTGLGLSTVFGIVNQSRGHVSVTSELGAGTTFNVYLPRTERLAETSGSSAPEPATLRGSETILLVEDDDQVRGTTTAILRRHGYHVLAARNGHEALRMSEALSDPIQLLVTDVVMPGMGGRDLADAICRVRREMKVLYISGYTEDSISDHGVDGLAISFLEKPITPDTLLRKVREVLLELTHP